jgi:aspartate racemase
MAIDMKVIGIIGGLSPESTAVYYKALNHGIRERTGNQHQAKIVLVSVDGGEIWALRQMGDWDGQGRIVADAAAAVERAGASFILLAGNTMHRCADQIERAIAVPFLHVVDATAKRIRARGCSTVGLTGTSFTMTERFYVDRLATHGIRAIVPDRADIDTLDRIIYRELCWGDVRANSRAEYIGIVDRLIAVGAEGVILGCSELTLYSPLECPVPQFDTTRIHIEEALDHALR